MTTSGDSSISSRLFGLLVALIYAGHLGLLLLACPPGVVFGQEPYGLGDYNTHFQQAHTIGQALDRFGRAWAYDPNMLAGVPSGLFFDLDSKAHTLFTHGLTRLGLPQVTAFNLFTLVSCLLAPLSILIAARLFRLQRGGQLVALSLAVLLWHFDSGTRFFWSGGMISFATVSHGSILALALFWRLMEHGRLQHWLPLLLLVPLLLLIHVWAFLILAVPMVGLYLARWRNLTLLGHARVWAIVLLSLGANAFWLWPALGHLELLVASRVLGQANPLYIVSDYLGVVSVLKRSDVMFLHTTFRIVALAGLILTLWEWRRSKDARLFFATLCAGWLIFLSYVAGLIPGLQSTEPYRFIAPTMMLAAALAGSYYSGLREALQLSRQSRSLKVLLLVLLLLLLPRPLREVLYFIPELMPPVYLGATRPDNKDREPALPEGAPRDHGGPFRLAGVRPEFVLVAAYLRSHCKQEGRLLVGDWPLGEYLRWATDRPIMGGFPERRTKHQAANIFRLPADPRLLGRALPEYLVRYNIRYVILTGPIQRPLEERSRLLTLQQIVGPMRIYRVNHLATYLARGTGTVKADLNRLEVTDARPAEGTQDLLLRFHHMDGLVCRPNCALIRTQVSDSPVGFITVRGRPRLPERFVVELLY